MLLLSRIDKPMLGSILPALPGGQRAPTGMTGSRPIIASRRAQLICKPALRRFWIPVQTFAADGGARPSFGGAPFRQPCPAYPFASGERHRRSVSARKSPNHSCIRKRISQPLNCNSPCYTLAEECNIQQAWMNSRNPTNIASRIEHRQHHLPASQYRVGKRPAIDEGRGSTCRFRLQPLHYRFSNSFSGSSLSYCVRIRAMESH